MKTDAIKISVEIRQAQYNIMNSQQMISPNKIKSVEQNLAETSKGFSSFIQSLRQRLPPHSATAVYFEANLSESPVSEQPINRKSQELLSEAAKSACLEEKQPQMHLGDPALKNKGRVGHGNRYTLRQYQLPPHFFASTKEKLEAHLRNSRIVPNNAEIQLDGSPTSVTKSKQMSQLFREGELSALQQSKVLKGKRQMSTLSDLDSDVALKYCLINRLTPSASPQEILLFFVRLLEILGYVLPEPKIEKYRDCIFFCPQVSASSKSINNEGLIYYFRGSLYYGQIQRHSMHGKGVQIFFGNNRRTEIYHGSFREGAMIGYFEVKKEDERYSGDIEGGVYHGYGKLTDSKGTVEGEFRGGKLVQKASFRSGKVARKRFDDSTEKVRNSSMLDLMPRGSSQDLREEQRENQKQIYSSSQSFSLNKKRGPQRYPQSFAGYQSGYDRFEPDPWSNPKYEPELNCKPKINPSDMLQFSYPFGGELMDSPRPRLLARGKPSRNNQNNPEIRHFPQSKNMEIQCNREPSYKTKPINNREQKNERLDSAWGEQQPLKFKL